jgi:predicted nucleotidyltransferase
VRNLKSNEAAALKKLKESLERNPRFVQMKLFGSKARGDSDRESDIDVLIVLEDYDRESRNAIYDLCYDLSVDFSVVLAPVIYTRKEFESDLTRATTFYQALAREAVSL